MESRMEQETEVTEATDTETTEATEETTEVVDETESRLGSIVESVLFAAGGPMTVKQLVDILKGPRGSGPKAKEVELALTELLEDYAPGKRGIHLLEVSGGYQFRTARENAQWVRAVFRDKPARLGRATLETLAIVAYKQPATRADIESVRGVDADAALSTLLERRLIKIAGRKETVGRPLLYSTTPDFLEAFGLKDLKDLPSLKELGPVPDEQEDESSTAADTETGAPSGGETIDEAGAQAAALSGREALDDPEAVIRGEAFDDPEALVRGDALDDAEAEAGALAGGDAIDVSDTEAGALAGEETPREAGAFAEPRDDDTEAAEAAEPGGDQLASQGGGDDPGGSGAGERTGGEGAGDEGGPESRPDNG